MRLSSAAFGLVIAKSHKIAVRADLLLGGEVVQANLPIVSGKVDCDRNAARMSRLNATFADPRRTVGLPSDGYAPYGYEIQVYRGVYISGVPEYISLGVFPIQRSTVSGLSDLTQVTAEDRSRIVSDARFEQDYLVAAGTNYVTAIENVLRDGYPGIQIDFPTTTYTTPDLVFADQSDRWNAVVQMARSIGMFIHFDGDGICKMVPEPNFTMEPVADFSDRVNLTGVSVGLSRDGVYNKVIAVSSNSSNTTQYRGEAADTNPSSPTYYDGPFGRKPRFHFSEFYNSNAQCEEGARAILASELGIVRSLDFTVVPDPRIECGDVVTITGECKSLQELHIIETISIGLDAQAAMTGTTRAQVI